jgi:hypothetical protein
MGWSRVAGLDFRVWVEQGPAGGRSLPGVPWAPQFSICRGPVRDRGDRGPLPAPGRRAGAGSRPGRQACPGAIRFWLAPALAGDHQPPPEGGGSAATAVRHAVGTEATSPTSPNSAFWLPITRKSLITSTRRRRRSHRPGPRPARDQAGVVRQRRQQRHPGMRHDPGTGRLHRFNPPCNWVHRRPVARRSASWLTWRLLPARPPRRPARGGDLSKSVGHALTTSLRGRELAGAGGRVQRAFAPSGPTRIWASVRGTPRNATASHVIVEASCTRESICVLGRSAL